ncbi:hypothetical protein SAMN06297358_0385 [Pedobacter xixiisoli]|uniref:Uncharacterized protein n=1 Tax=Pedobacter xixiisoli TaxID=1476464 RepID=A0A285ZQF6_9SPHI|nr:hypothetical protein SAMN06297358_0385 [Pedobacter xixiisoli]
MGLQKLSETKRQIGEVKVDNEVEVTSLILIR